MDIYPFEICKYPNEPESAREINNSRGYCIATIRRVRENEFTILSSEFETEWNKEKAYPPPEEY